MKFKVSEFVEMKKLGSKYILYNNSNSDSHVVNELAGEIFELLLSKPDSEDIIIHLTNKYTEVSSETIKNDVEELLNRYLELGLIVSVK